MYITVKGLTYAKFHSGGDGESYIQHTGCVLNPNLTVRADINFQYAEGQDYADGVRIANKRKITGVDLAFELADLPADMKQNLLGWVNNEGNEEHSNLKISEASPEFYGIGFYVWNEEPLTEDDNYIAYWIPKARFSVEGISVSTSNDSISYQHQTINGRGVGVKEPVDSKFWFVKTNKEPFATEEAAINWLKGEANYAGVISVEEPGTGNEETAVAEEPGTGG